MERRKYADRAEYLKAAVARRRRKIKLMVVAYLGGQCIKCGYKRCTAALEAHHKDPASKLFGLSLKGYCRSWERVRAEADKCELLCSNCHREKHNPLDDEIY